MKEAHLTEANASTFSSYCTKTCNSFLRSEGLYCRAGHKQGLTTTSDRSSKEYEKLTF
ncbi:unnamed protein product [Brassica oleracea var. botrytis]